MLYPNRIAKLFLVQQHEINSDFKWLGSPNDLLKWVLFTVPMWKFLKCILYSIHVITSEISVLSSCFCIFLFPDTESNSATSLYHWQFDVEWFWISSGSVWEGRCLCHPASREARLSCRIWKWKRTYPVQVCINMLWSFTWFITARFSYLRNVGKSSIRTSWLPGLLLRSVEPYHDVHYAKLSCWSKAKDFRCIHLFEIVPHFWICR